MHHFADELNVLNHWSSPLIATAAEAAAARQNPLSHAGFFFPL